MKLQSFPNRVFQASNNDHWVVTVVKEAARRPWSSAAFRAGPVNALQGNLIPGRRFVLGAPPLGRGV